MATSLVPGFGRALRFVFGPGFGWALQLVFGRSQSAGDELPNALDHDLSAAAVPERLQLALRQELVQSFVATIQQPAGCTRLYDECAV